MMMMSRPPMMPFSLTNHRLRPAWCQRGIKSTAAGQPPLSRVSVPGRRNRCQEEKQNYTPLACSFVFFWGLPAPLSCSSGLSDPGSGYRPSASCRPPSFGPPGTLVQTSEWGSESQCDVLSFPGPGAVSAACCWRWCRPPRIAAEGPMAF